MSFTDADPEIKITYSGIKSNVTQQNHCMQFLKYPPPPNSAFKNSCKILK